MTEEELDALRLRVILYGWRDLTDREAMQLQFTDYGFGCHAC